LVTTDPPNPGWGRIGLLLKSTGDEVLLGEVDFLQGCPDDEVHCWGSPTQIGVFK